MFSGGISGFKDIKYYLNKLKFYHKKLGTIGTSIGPFKNNKDFLETQELLNKFNYISVRDYSSLEYAKNMGLNKMSTFGFDNAILIKDVYPELSNSVKYEDDKIRIAVSLCHYESYTGGDIETEKQRSKSVLDLLQRIIDDDYNVEEIVFIIFNGNEDTGDSRITAEFNDIIKNKIKTRVIDYSSDTEEMVSEINNCDIMIGIRLHAGILAYALGIPFIQIEYHRKCTEFLNTVNHNHRFIIDNIDSNISVFEKLIEEKEVAGVISPDYFRNIMMNDLYEIKGKL